MEKIIKVATKELGIREYKDPRENPRILKYGKDTRLAMQEGDETPWCSIFLNWVCLKAGFERSKKPDARSWQRVGFSIDNPEPGDIVIYWREQRNSWKGHVGIFFGYSQDRSRIYTLGGNQGNSVSISGYSTDRLIEFRRLRKTTIRLTTKKLKRPDKGIEVVRLQDALKMAGYNCGTSDGYFGPMTERALKKLQKDSDIPVTGIFDAKSKTALKSIIC